MAVQPELGSRYDVHTGQELKDDDLALAPQADDEVAWDSSASSRRIFRRTALVGLLTLGVALVYLGFRLKTRARAGD